MRIALLIDRWWPRRGGAEAALCSLANHLLQAGDQVIAVAGRGPREHETSPCPVQLVRARGLTRARRERALGEALLGGAAEIGADVTLGVRHLPRVDLLWLHGGAHAATLAARERAGGRGLTSARRGRHRLFIELEREAVCGGARRIVVPSELVRGELLEQHPAAEPQRIEVVEPGVDLEAFHPRERAAARGQLCERLGLASDMPLIVHPARNPALKGARELLAALAPLTGRPWHLLIAGPRQTEVWRKEASRAGLSAERVSVLEDVPAPILAAGADLCALPTWRDTAGLVLLEALAAGTPVLTSRHAGLAAGLGTGAVSVDDPGDIARLSAALEISLTSGVCDPYELRASVESRGEDVSLHRIATFLRELAAPEARPTRPSGR